LFRIEIVSTQKFKMADPILILAVASGLILAVVNALLRKFWWRREPELSAFIEILLSTCAVAGAIKATKLALALQISDDHKLYFCLGAISLTWVSIAAILRKFRRRQKK
jgi:hypothetical protein